MKIFGASEPPPGLWELAWKNLRQAFGACAPSAQNKRKRHFAPLQELEDRCLLSASPVVPQLAPIAVVNNHAALMPVPLAAPASNATGSMTVSTPIAVQPAAIRRELVVIDTNVPDYQQLVQDIQKNQAPGTKIDVVALDGSQNGIVELRDILARYDHLDAIHIISHGSAGAVELGNQWLQLGDVNQYAQEIRAWGAALNPGGNILFYGCDFAGTTAGQHLLQQIHLLTGADVAASSNATGAAALGGDWNLEFAVGKIEASVPFSLALEQSWNHTLAVNNAVSGINVTGSTFLVSQDNSVVRINALTGAVVASYATGVANDGSMFGPDGSLYVADYYNNKILHYDATGAFLSSFGAGQLNSPQGVAFGPDGNLYVTDLNNRVLKYSPAGTFLGTFIAANSGGLSNAKAITWGPDGNAYVSSYFNSEVIRYDGATGAFMNVFATGSGGFEDLTFGPDKNLYVASYGDGAVYRYRGTDGAFLGTFVGGVPSVFGLHFDTAGNLDVSSRNLGQIRTYDGTTGAYLGNLVTGLTNPAYLTTTTSLVTTEMGTSASFQVVLLSQPTANVTINLTRSMPGQGSLSQSALTFNPGNWNIAQTVTVTGLDDGLLNGDQQYQITGVATSTDAIYNGRTMAPVSVVNREADSILPTASNDAFNTNVNTALNVAASGVLGNDTGPPALTLTANLISGPTHGTLALNANGSFTYVPNANYFGSDSFTYRANDGLFNSNLATVSLTINSLPPVAANDSFSTNVNTVLNVAPGNNSVLGNDSDPQARPLSAILVSGPTNGSVTLNANGSFRYTPNANYFGADSFTYKANDGLANSNIATVALTINSLPPLAVNDSFSTNVNAPLNVAASGVLANDTDPQARPLTAILVSGPGNGTLTLNANGSFRYTPNANYIGADSFTYRANDGLANSNVVTVTLTVNSMPPVAMNDTFGTNTNTPLNVAASGVLANDTDPQGRPITAILVSGPGNGTVTLNANGSFLYTPNLLFTGPDSFTYRANDGLANSNIAVVSLTVNAIAPVANNDSFSTNANTPLNLAATGVLANDTDPLALPLTAVLMSAPSNGALTLNANGSFLYTPNANFVGIDSFTYFASDGLLNSNNATVSLTVNSVAPVAANDSFSTNVNTPLNVLPAGVLTNDTDPQAQPLTAILVSGPSNGSVTLGANGSFTYTANANYFGPDSFTYKANDGLVDSNVATVSLTVNSLPPLASNDSFNTNVNTPLNVLASGVLANDTDPQARPLTAILVSGPSHGSLTLNANGAFAYTANANYTGLDSFNYRANDGSTNSNVATVSLTVNSLPPMAANDSFSTNVNMPLNVLPAGVLGNDTDPQARPLTAILVSGPSNGSVILNANGSFTYTANANYFGPDSFTYKANDGLANSNVATVSLTVNPLPPVANNDSFITSVNTPLNVRAAGVLANDFDPQARPLTAVLVSGASKGTVTLNANGSFTYTANANYFGADSFTYRTNDGLANSNIATVSLAINPIVLPVLPASPPAPLTVIAPAVLLLVPSVSPTTSALVNTGARANPTQSLSSAATIASPPSTITPNARSGTESLESGVQTLTAQAIVSNRTLQVFAPIPQALWRPVQELGIVVPPEESLFHAALVRTLGRPMTQTQAQAPQADDLLDVLNDDGERIAWSEPGVETTVLAGTGILAGTGYVLLNSRLGLGLLGLLTARPMWKQFDPLEVLYAWEDDGRNRTNDDEEETLMSLVD